MKNNNNLDSHVEPAYNRSDVCHMPWAYTLVKSDAFLHLSSGAFAGAASRTLTAPLDRIKVVMQLKGGSTGMSFYNAVSQIVSSELTIPKGSKHASLKHNRNACCSPVKQVLSNRRNRVNSKAYLPLNINRVTFHALCKGWKGFFRGNMTNCLKVVPESALKFYIYNLIKEKVSQYKWGYTTEETEYIKSVAEIGKHFTDSAAKNAQKSELCFGERLFCGALAGVIVQLLIYPMEILKTRLVAYSPSCHYSGIFECFSNIIKEGGVRRLYRGLFPSIIGVIPYAGIDLACFETFKSLYVQHVLIPQYKAAQSVKSTGMGLDMRMPINQDPNQNVLRHFDAIEEYRRYTRPGVFALLFMGGLSSLMGQVIAYPTALIRTRMQVDGCSGHQIKYKNSFEAAKVAIYTSGIKGLYRGLGANLMKAVPAVGISWFVYEKSKEFISWGILQWEKKCLFQQRKRVA